MNKDIVYYHKRWDAPTECPCCGSKLTIDGVDLCCKNPDCADKKLRQTVDFIKRLGVKSASEATLSKFGIKDIESLIAFKADPKYKSETKLRDELLAKVFNRSKQELLAAMNFEDLGETLINKIVDFYGYDNISEGMQYVGLPDGVGELTLQKFKDKIQENLKLVDMFVNDCRYCYIENAISTAKTQKNGMSVCFTGALNTMSRSQASKLAEEHGFEVKSGVSKGLTYLITNTPDSGSSKNKKAQQLGTKVITEEEFLNICNGTESDVMSF